MAEETRAGASKVSEVWLSRKESLATELEKEFASQKLRGLSAVELRGMGETLARLKVGAAVSARLSRTRLDLAGMAGAKKPQAKAPALYTPAGAAKLPAQPPQVNKTF